MNPRVSRVVRRWHRRRPASRLRRSRQSSRSATRSTRSRTTSPRRRRPASSRRSTTWSPRSRAGRSRSSRHERGARHVDAVGGRGHGDRDGPSPRSLQKALRSLEQGRLRSELLTRARRRSTTSATERADSQLAHRHARPALPARGAAPPWCEHRSDHACAQRSIRGSLTRCR